MIDVLVIGGGLAGWRAAEAAVAAGCSVALVANGSGNSPDIHALNVPVGAGDSVELFVEDTLKSGGGACDPALVEVLCRESVKLAEEFPFDRNADGLYKMIQPLGCSVPRCVSIDHKIGAWALARIKRALKGKVELVQGRVTALETGGSQFTATVSDAQERVPPVMARAVVLATGGWCGKYDFSDNPPELRGDGIALAQSLGAAVRDLDAVQYEPTVALAPARLRGIPVITTMLHEGATFRNRLGDEFLPDKHANKDAISQAIRAEIEAGRGVPARGAPGTCGVWYDATGVPREILETRYADTVRRYTACGIDITREPMLVAPAPHTSLGGVAIDVRCRVLRADGTPIPGLFAAGEVTGGVHGRNRLGGNAGTEVLVFGKIAGESAAQYGNRPQ
jgi:succinate dehydrogenase/fumarate reductase flavoprotein subunit